MTPKLKHRGGSAPCAACGTVAICEWLDGDDRWPACPECARELHDHPEMRSGLPTPPPAVPDHHWWDFATAVEELNADLEKEFPDPVDVFEDQLADQLGLKRHSALSQNEWRRVRVRYIEATEPMGE